MKSVPWNGKTIALDIGCVCISLHRERCYKAFGVKNGEIPPMGFLLSCRELATGRIAEGEWLKQISKMSEGRLSPEQVRDAWNSMLGDSIPGMKDAVKEILLMGYRFAYLSDTSSIHMTHFLRTNDFCHLASGGIYSYEVGAEKPENAMYEAFERKYGKPVYYTDDIQKNIDAALARGWRAELYTSPENFLHSIVSNPP